MKKVYLPEAGKQPYFHRLYLFSVATGLLSDFEEGDYGQNGYVVFDRPVYYQLSTSFKDKTALTAGIF